MTGSVIRIEQRKPRKARNAPKEMEWLEVWLEGVEFVKLGPWGLHTFRTRSAEEAAEALAHEVKMKKRQGWEEVPMPPPEPVPPARAASNPELEAMIDAAPDDGAAYSVYGDWLAAQGDPRGELIALQSRMEDLPNQAFQGWSELNVLSTRLLLRYREHLLGAALADRTYPSAQETWTRGFLSGLKLHHEQLPAARAGRVERVVAILTAPAARFLRKLDLLWSMEPDELDAIAAALKRKGVVRPTVNELLVGFAGNLDVLWPIFPGLKKLELLGEDIRATTFRLPALEELVAGTYDASPLLPALVASPLPVLRKATLALRTRTPAFALLCETKTLPALTELALEVLPNDPTLPETLLRGPRIRTLRTLRLGSEWASEHLSEILRHPEAFAKMETLSLGGARISAAEKRALQKLGPKIEDAPVERTKPATKTRPGGRRR